MTIGQSIGTPFEHGPSPSALTSATLLTHDDVTDPARRLGYNTGLRGAPATPPQSFCRAERAAYFRGHIRGTLARRAAR